MPLAHAIKISGCSENRLNHGDSLASLASNGDPEEGGLAPPPRKKSRIVESTMQQQQQQQPASNGCSEHNGTSSPDGEEVQAKIMDRTNQDIVRLIGQHLKTVGLKYDPLRFITRSPNLVLSKILVLLLGQCIVGACIFLAYIKSVLYFKQQEYEIYRFEKTYRYLEKVKEKFPL